MGSRNSDSVETGCTIKLQDEIFPHIEDEEQLISSKFIAGQMASQSELCDDNSKDEDISPTSNYSLNNNYIFI